MNALTTQPVGQVTPQSLSAVVGVMMAVWFGIFVISQAVKVFKGEEVERPPLTGVGKTIGATKK